MGYDYYGSDYIGTNAVGAIIWVIIALVLAIIGGILVYVLFLSPKNEMKLSKFLTWLKEFLNFNVMITEIIMKVIYLVGTIFIVLASFALLPTYGFLSFLLALIVGPITLRLIYEGIMMFIMIWKNTNDINKKTK